MTERTFLGWSRPLLSLAVPHLIDRVAADGVLDLRGHHVVLPGGRGVRRFKELLLEEANRRDLRLVPPATTTVGFLPEVLYSPRAPLAGRLESHRAWTQAARSADGEAIARLFGSAPSPGDWRAWERIGSELARLHRDVGSGGHRFGDVIAVFGEHDLPYDDSHRWRLLAELQRRYLALLESGGLADREMERIDALSGDVRADGPIWLIGTADFPGITARLLAAASSPVRSLVHAPENEADAFDDLGRIQTAAWQQRQLSLEAGDTRVVDRPTGQAGEVVRGVAELGGVRRSDVVVASADPALSPYLKDWFSAAGLPIHDAAGTPIDRTGPFRLLQAVGAFLERSRWPELAALARHPDLDDRLRRGSRAPRIGPLDAYFRDHLPDDLATPLPEGRFEDGRRFLRTLQSDDYCGRFQGERPLGEWGKVIVDFLLEVYGDVPLDRAQPEGRRTLDVLMKVRSAALSLYRLPPPLSPPGRAATALYLLLEQVRSDAVAEESRDDSIEMLGWLELPLDDAPHVFVVGVNEGYLPSSTLGHVFLPDRLRGRLGIQDNRLRYARDAFFLEALKQSRRSIRLISGRVTPQGDPLRPSRLLLTARGEDLARRVLDFAEGRPPRIEAPLVAEAGGKSAFRLPPEPVLIIEPPEEIQVTAFRSLLADPYRWAIENHLRLESQDDGWREIDASRFGQVAHDVLAAFGRSPASRSPDVTVVRAQLDQRLDEEWEKRFGTGTFPAIPLQKELLRMRLHAFATWQAKWARKGWEPYLIEGRRIGDPEGEGDDVISAPFEVDGVEIVLRGRLDRVDINPTTGEIAVLDYKTGESPTLPNDAHLSRKEWKDLQLPLYRHLLRTLAEREDFPPGIDLEKPLLGYILLSRDLDRAGGFLAEWTDEQLAEADEAARSVVRFLRGGEIRFDRSRVRSWPGDPIRPVLGMRVLLGDEDEALPIEEELEELE